MFAWEIDYSTERRKLVLNRIDDFNANLSRDDRNTKYRTMSESQFAFLRGTNHLYWQDMGTSIGLNQFGNRKTTRTWLNGDAHINNIGAFTNCEGELVFDLNDFDEAVIGDFQLDLWRMAISIQVMMESELKMDGIEVVIDAFIKAYHNAVKSPRQPITIGSTANHENKLLHEFLIETWEKKSRADMLKKYTQVDGKRVFTKHKDLKSVGRIEYAQVEGALLPYIDRLMKDHQFAQGYFNVKDVNLRVNAGIGGLGMPRYYVLIEGPSSSLADDIILDLKAQSSGSASLNMDQALLALTQTHNHAQRTVLGYTSMAFFPDALLGYVEIANVHYSVRERNPYKRSFKPKVLRSVSDCLYMAETWAQILATAHVRANPAFALDANLEDFADYTYNTVNAWAKQVNIDFQTFHDNVIGADEL